MTDRTQLLAQLEGTLAELLAFCNTVPDYDVEVYPGWSVLDVLGHLTFWHESFARNLVALVAGRKPRPLNGRYADLDRRCKQEMRAIPPEGILARLGDAQRTIRVSILHQGLATIPYRTGSREYTPEEHLQIVNDHLASHLRDMRSSSKSRI